MRRIWADAEIMQVGRPLAVNRVINGERSRLALTDLADFPLGCYPQDFLWQGVWTGATASRPMTPFTSRWPRHSMHRRSPAIGISRTRRVVVPTSSWRETAVGEIARLV
jgi:hypothetical protein